MEVVKRNNLQCDHKTEGSVKYSLRERGVIYKDNSNDECIIRDVPFNTRHIYKPDLLIESCKGEKLYIEIKGQMTYEAVNRALYMFTRHDVCFYLMQLTEIDWMQQYDKSKHGTRQKKSKADYEFQINELSKFYNGILSAGYIKDLSQERLRKWIMLKKKLLKSWLIQ